MLPDLDVAVLEALRRFFSDEGTAEPQSLDFKGFCAAFGEAMDAEEDDGAGLTAEEIAAFRQRNSGASDSPPVRFKDRVAEPLSAVQGVSPMKTAFVAAGWPKPLPLIV